MDAACGVYPHLIKIHFDFQDHDDDIAEKPISLPLNGKNGSAHIVRGVVQPKILRLIISFRFALAAQPHEKTLKHYVADATTSKLQRSTGISPVSNSSQAAKANRLKVPFSEYSISCTMA